MEEEAARPVGEGSAGDEGFEDEKRDKKDSEGGIAARVFLERKVGSGIENS